MIELNKTRLPQSIRVNGGRFFIHTDFRYWLRFCDLLADQEVKAEAFDFMYLAEPPKNRLKGLYALAEFCNPPRDIPRDTGDTDNGTKIIDYKIDADYIYSAFYEVYKIDLLTAKLHWYQFNALLRGLHDTKLNEIMGYRAWENKTGRRDEYTKAMDKLKKQWELPDAQKPDQDLINFEKLLRPQKQG